MWRQASKKCKQIPLKRNKVFFFRGGGDLIPVTVYFKQIIGLVKKALEKLKSNYFSKYQEKYFQKSFIEEFWSIFNPVDETALSECIEHTNTRFLTHMIKINS